MKTINYKRTFTKVIAYIIVMAIMFPAIVTIFNGNEDMIWVNFVGLAYAYGVYCLSAKTERGRKITRKIYKLIG